MRAYSHSFQGFPEGPHYQEGPHFGYEQAGATVHRVGDFSDVTFPGMLFPPVGIAQALSGHVSSSSGSSPSRSHWSTAALLAVLVGGAVAVFAIYKITKAAAPLSEKAGEGVTRLLAARYGAGDSGRARRATMLPPEPRSIRALPAPRSERAFALSALPEHEAFK